MFEKLGAGMSSFFSRLSMPWHGLGALLVGLMLAHWTWVVIAPQRIAVFPEKNWAGGEQTTAQLFGVAAAPGVGAASAAAEMPSLRLVGVFTGEHGFAVLSLNGQRQLGVALGGEVSPGLRLVEIAPKFVFIEGKGRRIRVELDEKYVRGKSL